MTTALILCASCSDEADPQQGTGGVGVGAAGSGGNAGSGASDGHGGFGGGDPVCVFEECDTPQAARCVNDANPPCQPCEGNEDCVGNVGGPECVDGVCVGAGGHGGSGGMVVGSLDPCSPFADDCSDSERCGAVFSFDASNEVVESGFLCTGPGPAAEGQECRGSILGTSEFGGDLVGDTCRGDLFCATLDQSRRCRRYCDGGEFGCEADAFCLGLVMSPLLAVCVPADDCDALAQDCGSGRGCYLVAGGSGALLSHCFDFAPPAGGTGAVGTACSFIGDCQPGADCIEGQCASFCDRGLPVGSCPVSQSCQQLGTPVAASTPVGFCG